MKQFNFELKSSDADAGSFSGYASIFGNVDLMNDRVVPGAFKEIVRAPNGGVVTLWMHDQTRPIGSAVVEQDEKGLRVEGQLILADPEATKARAHLKAKTINGMSIGYDILPGGQRHADDGVRELTGLKLWEVSLVTFPANPRATVSAAKSVAACVSVAELEDLFREVLVLSGRKAKRLASAAWPIVSSTDPDPQAEELSQLINQFEAITNRS